ncbi:BTAD domain-containing putative transcriptional regulator [Muricoccus radiodurans]|uniref:BTAD domain-containing putative transcriptional regulator n=1 Tax=Muricoccus radiodurans TaxID=2231721 RepID=UPI003CF0BD0A
MVADFTTATISRLDGSDPDLAGSAATVRLSLLGPVRAEDRYGQEIPIRGRKSRALLGYVALAGGRAVPRSKLAAMLWDRVPEEQARASLRQALKELASVLPGGRGGVLQADHDGVRVNPDALQVDAWALDSPLVTAMSGPRPGELMEGLEGLSESFDDWLLPERRHLAARRQAAQEARLEQLLSEPGGSPSALEAAEALLAVDPAHEGAWRAVIRLTAERGDGGRALQAYERCRETLKRLLDVEPSAETRDLAAGLRASLQVPASARTTAPSCPAPATELPPLPEPEHRLRVGVLPFSAAGAGESEDLARAHADDAALELARFRRFDIIAPLALRELRDHPSRTACEAFRLDYLVDGALRREGGNRQLQMSLLDVTELARPLWSGRVALSPHGAEEVESTAIRELVAKLDPVIVHAAGTRRGAASRFDATCAVLRAIPLLYSLQRDRFEQAGKLLAGAVAREPDNAMAAAWAACWHVYQIGQGWTPDPTSALQEAERLASLAMRLDPENAEATGIYGHVCSFLHKDFDSAAYYLDRGLEMNPYQASAWAMSAPTHCYAGNPEGALQRLERYRSLAPAHPYAQVFDHIFTMSHTFAGNFEEAVKVGRRSVRASPGFINGYKSLLSAMGHLGQKEEAKPYLDELLRLEPGFNVRNFVRAYPFRRAEDRERYAEGLRLAGAPKF